MEEHINLCLLWLLFGLSHIALSIQVVRSRMVNLLGEGWFILCYSMIAITTFYCLVSYYADNRPSHEVGFGYSLSGLTGYIGAVLILLGMALLNTCITGYISSPMAVFSQKINSPTGIQRITRHPFLSGFALIFTAHLMFSSAHMNAIFFGGFVVLCVAGMIHQDKKLLSTKGDVYRQYLAQSSAFPFLAIIQGRQKLEFNELPWPTLLMGGTLAIVLYYIHGSLMKSGGLWFITAIVGIAVLELIFAWRVHVLPTWQKKTN